MNSDIYKAEQKLSIREASSCACCCNTELVESNRRMRSALERIVRWIGEFPESGRFWNQECTRPMSYGAAFGSNGERDYMRSIAREALNPMS